MVPYVQKEIGDNTGSCVATCIASILELPQDEVPNFILEAVEKNKSVFDVAAEWLKERGKRFISLSFYSPEDYNPATEEKILNRAWVGYSGEAILCGLSPRKKEDGGNKYHAVIGRAKGWGFELVHDPHPDGNFIVGEPYAVYWIV